MTAANSPPSRSFWITLARILWVLLAVILLVIFVAGLPFRFKELTTLCLEDPCIPLILTEADAAALENLGMSINFYAGFHTAIEVIGVAIFIILPGLIFWRKSDEWIGILASSTLLLFGLNFMVEADKSLVMAYPALELPHTFLTLLSGVLFILLLFLFPDGSFAPHWTRWIALGFAVISLLDPVSNRLGLTTPSGQFSLVLTIAILPTLVIGIGAQIYRYRYVSSSIERQQTKWVVFGFSMLVVIIFAWSLFLELFPLPPGLPRLVFNLPVFALLAIAFFSFPISMGISIMRYRLWDIDVIIRRTLVYGLLTGLIVVIYFGLVLFLQSIVAAVGGEQSTIAIVLSTLAIAALFNPLRRRVQTFIDRRFYRQKYDAEKALVAFSLTVREEVDLESLSRELLNLVSETMQPESTSVWLKESQE